MLYTRVQPWSCWRRIFEGAGSANIQLARGGADPEVGYIHAALGVSGYTASNFCCCGHEACRSDRLHGLEISVFFAVLNMHAQSSPASQKYATIKLILSS